MSVPKAAPLLKTKLCPQPVTGRLIARPRLFGKLNQGLSGPLTVVCASAGFGKTTLVSSWLSSLQPEVPSVWLALDADDSDLSTFANYLIAALRAVFPGACSETRSLIKAPQPPPPKVLHATLNNDLARLAGRFVVVLDDYHKIHGTAIHELLDDLLLHWPTTMHLVLISRHGPPLQLSRLRAGGELVEIRSHDLRFTREETAAYLERVLPTPLSDNALTRLEQESEGWIAGMQLVGLSLAASANPEAYLSTLAGADANVTAYLVDEVLSLQPAPIRRFLLATSILDRFCAPLCEAIIGDDNRECVVPDCIGYIDSANLFLTPLDNQRQWFRYHSLFRGLLRQKLQAEQGAEYTIDLHRRAAAWYAEQGLVPETLHHSQKANDFEHATRLIVRSLTEVLNREDRLTLDEWLRLLPAELVQNRPDLRIVRAWSLHFSWQPRALANEILEVERLLESDGIAAQVEDMQLLRSQILGLRSQLAFFANQPSHSVAYSREVLDTVSLAHTFLRGGVILYLGLSMQIMGQGRTAEQMLLDRYESLSTKSDAYALRHLFSLGFVYLQSGQLERAKDNAEVLFRQATLGRLPILVGWSRFFLGTIAFHRNDLGVARRHFADLVHERYMIHALAARDGLAGLALALLAVGETAASAATVGLLTQLDLDRIGHEEDRTRSLRARLQLLQGDLEGAGRWADGYTDAVPDRPLLWLEEPHITRARILVRRNDDGDVHQALAILSALDELAERTHNVSHRVEIMALRALAFDVLGDAASAHTALLEAVALSQRGEFVRVFIDLGSRMQEMLGRLSDRDGAGVAVRRILAGFRDSETSTLAPGLQFPALVQQYVLPEALTPREIDVLWLMGQRLSDKEIAARLVLSPLTVKRHAVNIYGKLGVHGRWDAVIRAGELGIFPPQPPKPS